MMTWTVPETDPNAAPFTFEGTPEGLTLFRSAIEFEKIAVIIYPDHLFYRVFAYGVVMGWPDEYKERALNTLVKLGQYRFKLYQGAEPIDHHLAGIKSHISELTKNGIRTEWLGKLVARFNLKGWQSKDFSEDAEKHLAWIESYRK